MCTSSLMPGIIVLYARICARCSGYRPGRGLQARSGKYCIIPDPRAGPTAHERGPPPVGLRHATVRLQNYGSTGQICGFDPLVGRKQVVGHFHPTRELFSADPRVGPADLARGSVFLKTYSCLPEGHSRDPRSCPRVRNDTILAASCLKASLGAMLRTPSAYQSV